MAEPPEPAGGEDPGGVGPWLALASPEVRAAWAGVHAAAVAEPPLMGLAAGERPAADVEVLAATVAAAEYTLAARMHAAASAGCLPLPDRGGTLAARGWSVAQARRLARCGALAAGNPGVAAAWAAGTISAEHVDPVARAADRFTIEELAAVLEHLTPMWGALAPPAVTRFVAAADRLLHPPDDPTRDEVDAYESRSVAFSVLGDRILLSAELPRVEGELVMAAIEALAEQRRSTIDPVPAGARRADALVELTQAAAASGALPTRGGLPVALTVTLEHTRLDDPIWTTSRGHQLTQAESRWAGCDADVTPVLLETAHRCGPGPDEPGLADHPPAGWQSRGARPTTAGSPSAAARIAALAATLFDRRIPLAVGRTQRTATPAQRRALAARDRGCVIPGCAVPAEACQAHHLTDWADGGRTDVEGLALLCWTHHRQVDLRMWTIHPLRSPLPEPRRAGRGWPANHGAPFTIARTPRSVWRT
ncbi:MAG: HNH endonuclease [Candidatus Nanopelagicales bacterium]|nr:HNH endonuclease [Candidatus Nanopelagicales bacterium]